ncbi:hypothetical protein [Streptomyces sp. NBC_00140]|uniref:hypothetical protein n=1 Tax=Streptomyces sp. NBC_00140 TaxID=2975664 RepID=UPI002258477B|nr:hypothetical protein [Streptomyces sp. NBC_00140]MCX5332094.1 hypothetical protein [Streptomyces sp. NBC_00140]
MGDLLPDRLSYGVTATVARWLAGNRRRNPASSVAATCDHSDRSNAASLLGNLGDLRFHCSAGYARVTAGTFDVARLNLKSTTASHGGEGADRITRAYASRTSTGISHAADAFNQSKLPRLARDDGVGALSLESCDHLWRAEALASANGRTVTLFVWVDFTEIPCSTRCV